MKGCYLGQETVARIDALGHVNKHLRGLRLADDAGMSLAGATIEHEGKAVGTLTSASRSPDGSHVLALALLRTAAATPGTEVDVRIAGDASNTAIKAVVHDLPFAI